LTEVVEKIAGLIEIRGIISFAEFMQVALYCPKYGFYEREKDIIGRRGDFFTSVSVGELFGHLLAFQFAEWLALEMTSSQATSDAKVHIVEAGAHRGEFARDVLGWIKENRPELFEKIEYRLIEPSERRREWQARTLEEFRPQVRWFQDFEGMGAEGVSGVIFSNELLDAMPVHRVGWDAKERRWFEWGVVSAGSEFRWERMQPGQGLDARKTWLGELPPALLDVLPDGFVTEVCLKASRWWSNAARCLRSGKLMTIDYGFALEELLAPERSQGTLRAYRGHRVAADVLAHPGEQDLTAHINFTAIENAGLEAGLGTEAFTTQSRYLTAILARMRSEGALPEDLKPALARQFKTLTSPDLLGRAFRVLVQNRA
jgi:SAM-dependent MidA family methyltransferase